MKYPTPPEKLEDSLLKEITHKYIHKIGGSIDDIAAWIRSLISYENAKRVELYERALEASGYYEKMEEYEELVEQWRQAHPFRIYYQPMEMGASPRIATYHDTLEDAWDHIREMIATSHDDEIYESWEEASATNSDSFLAQMISRLDAKKIRGVIYSEGAMHWYAIVEEHQS